MNKEKIWRRLIPHRAQWVIQVKSFGKDYLIDIIPAKETQDRKNISNSEH